jgi:hypothetical protein
MRILFLTVILFVHSVFVFSADEGEQSQIVKIYEDHPEFEDKLALCFPEPIEGGSISREILLDIGEKIDLRLCLLKISFETSSTEEDDENLGLEWCDSYYKEYKICDRLAIFPIEDDSTNSYFIDIRKNPFGSGYSLMLKRKLFLGVEENVAIINADKISNLPNLGEFLQIDSSSWDVLSAGSGKTLPSLILSYKNLNQESYFLEKSLQLFVCNNIFRSADCLLRYHILIDFYLFSNKVKEKTKRQRIQILEGESDLKKIRRSFYDICLIELGLFERVISFI